MLATLVLRLPYAACAVGSRKGLPSGATCSKLPALRFFTLFGSVLTVLQPLFENIHCRNSSNLVRPSSCYTILIFEFFFQFAEICLFSPSKPYGFLVVIFWANIYHTHQVFTYTIRFVTAVLWASSSMILCRYRFQDSETSCTFLRFHS